MLGHMTMSPLSRLFFGGTWLPVILYPIALVVAFFVSIITAVSLLGSGVPLWFTHAVTGFTGVLAGSLCLVRCSRLVGSVFLLSVGLAFFYFRFVRIDEGFNPEGFSNPWARLFMLYCGGLVAVVVVGVWELLTKRVTKHEDVA
jgi:hypothetical protein